MPDVLRMQLRTGPIRTPVTALQTVTLRTSCISFEQCVFVAYVSRLFASNNPGPDFDILKASEWQEFSQNTVRTRPKRRLKHPVNSVLAETVAD